MWFQVVFLSAIFTVFIVYYPPRCLIRFIQWCNPSILFFYDLDRKAVALTIDDSPSEITRQISQIIKNNQCSGTFFMIGKQIEKYDSNKRIRQKIMDDGHEMGNHGYYDHVAAFQPVTSIDKEIRKTDALLRTFMKQERNYKKYRWFRPGSGWFTSSMIDLVTNKHNSVIALGSCYPYDPLVHDFWLNYNYILSKITSGDIIILHDRPWTIPLLRSLLPELKQRGFEVMSLSQLHNLHLQESGK